MTDKLNPPALKACPTPLSPAPLYATYFMLLAQTAKEVGYCLTIHGTMQRDLDVVAIPWTPEAVSADELIEIFKKKHGLLYMEPSDPNKPHGRIAYALAWDAGLYVDISVMPRNTRPAPEPASELRAALKEVRDLVFIIPLPSGGHHAHDCGWNTGENEGQCDCGWNDTCDEARDMKKRALHAIDTALSTIPKPAQPAQPAEDSLTRPTVVCLCGSTRFMEAFRQANLVETIAGKIVLTVGCDTKSDSDLIALGKLTEADKAKLDELHKRKIDLCDEVLILNVGGYIGSSTKSEIEYAKAHGKRLRWLEPV